MANLGPVRLPAPAWRQPETVTALRARDVGTLLRIAQKHTGASQTRVAAAIGLSQSRTNEVVNGRRQVGNLDVLERIAAGLAMPDGARMLLGLAPVVAGQAQSMDDLPTGPGVVSRVYPSQAQAAPDIRSRIAGAASVDVLVVRGLGLLALNDSLLRVALTAARARPVHLRVALLAPDGEAAARRADEIGESPESFAAGVRLSRQRLAELARNPGVAVQAYLYDRTPVWRLVTIDDAMFVGTFDAGWEGHVSPAYRLDPGTGGALYRGMRRMYEDLLASATRII